MQHDSPVSLDDVAAQDNDLRTKGAAALLPALEKLTSLTSLDVSGTCGYVQRRERAGQSVVVVVCDGLFVCELCGFRSVRSTDKGSRQPYLGLLGLWSGARTVRCVCVCVCVCERERERERPRDRDHGEEVPGSS